MVTWREMPTEALVKQNLGQMANDAEKAKAYNKLVDLAMKQFNDQQSIQQTNQIMKKNDPVDEAAMSEGAYNALINAIECYKYDQLPNAKGKVAPKFNNNASRVWGARVQLVNAGQTAAQNNKADEVLKYWGAFLDTDNEPLFASVDQKQKDGEKEYIGQVALFAARYAYQAKDNYLQSRAPSRSCTWLCCRTFLLRSNNCRTMASSLLSAHPRYGGMAARWRNKPASGALPPR